MSLTLIAMTGILVGFLCLVIGFFMDESDSRASVVRKNRRAGRPMRKKIIVPRRKAA
jgi:hypothetical protein